MTPNGRPTAITNAADAALVKGMAIRGDPQSDIGTWFGVNHGRINEIIKVSTPHAEKFRNVAPAPPDLLPPPGPYPARAALLELKRDQTRELNAVHAELAEVREELRVTAHERRQTNELIAQLQRQLAAFGRGFKLIDTTPPKPTGRGPLAG